jgi:hypothetical protein
MKKCTTLIVRHRAPLLGPLIHVHADLSARDSRRGEARQNQRDVARARYHWMPLVGIALLPTAGMGVNIGDDRDAVTLTYRRPNAGRFGIHGRRETTDFRRASISQQSDIVPRAAAIFRRRGPKHRPPTPRDERVIAALGSQRVFPEHDTMELGIFSNSRQPTSLDHRRKGRGYFGEIVNG